MKKNLVISSFAATIFSVSAIANAGPPTRIILDSDYTVEGTLRVGKEITPIKLLVDAATPDRPILNPIFVEKTKLKKSMVGGGFGIGPIRISANTKVLDFNFGGMDWKRRSMWADRPITRAFDGSVGPGGIPYDIIAFNLRSVQSGEQLYVLNLVENGNSVAQLEIGGKTIDITFTLKRSKTLATAAAGAIIAESHGGAFHGATDMIEIGFGVERPIRNLGLSQSLVIIGRPLGSIFVRTRDNGDVSGIADVENAALGDANEIVVIAKKDKNRYSLSIGRDDLSHCSSITYDKPAKKIRFSCLPQ